MPGQLLGCLPSGRLTLLHMRLGGLGRGKGGGRCVCGEGGAGDWGGLWKDEQEMSCTQHRVYMQ